MNELIVQIVAPLIVSIVGGGLSMAIAFKVVQHRMAEAERRISELEEKSDTAAEHADAKIDAVREDVVRLRTDIGDVRASVKAIEGYMRGATDARQQDRD